MKFFVVTLGTYKEQKKILLFSDINLYHTSHEWENMDGHECGWFPCVGRLSKLKRWFGGTVTGECGDHVWHRENT